MAALTLLVVAGRASTLPNWPASVLRGGERLVCEKKIGRDHFFVASAKDSLVLGYQLDVTSNASKPMSYTSGWKFEDGSGDSVDLAGPPAKRTHDTRAIKGRIVSEKVEVQSFSRSVRGTSIKVSFEFKKFGGDYSQPSELPGLESQDDRVMVSMCEVQPR